MTTTCKYTVDFLRMIGNCAKSKVNYPLFGLKATTRAWIISLGKDQGQESTDEPGQKGTYFIKYIP